MKNVLNLSYRSVALCGYRKQGRELYKKLQATSIEIPYIIERNYQALSLVEKDLGTSIVGFGENAEFYQQAEVILLTGDLPEGIVYECLEIAGINVPVITSIEV